MEKFPHLNFVQKLIGKPRYPRRGGENPITKLNRIDRQWHGGTLQNSALKIKLDWKHSYEQRKTQDLAIIDETITPVFLQINPDIINAEFDLDSFGIEIISEEENGFIIGASFDNLRSLEEKIRGFITSNHGTGKIADFWSIVAGNREVWRPEHILSEYLYLKWHEINDEEQYHVEVSIAFAKPLGKEPDPAKHGGIKRNEKYRIKLLERDDLLIERQNHFEEFINHYGKLESSFVELDDSFGCEVLISGRGLKDLVINYQYVFEVSEIDKVTGIIGVDGNYTESEFRVLPPKMDSTEVGVIDSGIMEGNKYIASAIKTNNSKSYIEGETSTADYVKGGGHGTKVAGAILYPKGISETDSPYVMPCFIRNLRVLNNDNYLPHKYPASLMQTIVNDNEECTLFNLSISSNTPYRKKHMSAWAAVIDKLIFENDILFFIPTGNIKFAAIKEFVTNGKSYPDYLDESICRLANPSQSCFSIAVGSINHVAFEDNEWSSLGGENDISAFSRIGTGIWESIKPDVVEYGGGLVISKNNTFRVKEHEVTSPELIRSTLHGGGAVGRDRVGTSFSTPKVTHIAAYLKQLYPEESVNLIRALIAQGARLPNDYFLNPTSKSIQYYGYGIPLLERVVKNSEHRITFYNSDEIRAEECHLYSLSVPKELRDQGNEYDILIEVTLAYSAQVRRTRQKTKFYLSTWLDWTTSKIGELFDDFKDYVLKEINGDETNYESAARKEYNSFDWKIKSRTDVGAVQGINRNNSSLQKDWTVIKSYDLPKEISFAVRGHKGWDRNKMGIPYAITVSVEILGTNIPIYEVIRIENEIEIEVSST